MPRQEDAGLLNTKSILSDLSTSTMKSEPGRPGRVPGAARTLWVANSACAATVDGRVAAGLATSTAAEGFPCPVADAAVAAPVIATPARNSRRLTSVGAFLRATVFPRILFRHFRLATTIASILTARRRSNRISLSPDVRQSSVPARSTLDCRTNPHHDPRMLDYIKIILMPAVVRLVATWV